MLLWRAILLEYLPFLLQLSCQGIEDTIDEGGTMVRRVVLCQLDILIDRDLSRDKWEVEELRHSEIEQEGVNIRQTLTTPPGTQHRLDELHLIMYSAESDGRADEQSAHHPRP